MRKVCRCCTGCVVSTGVTGTIRARRCVPCALPTSSVCSVCSSTRSAASTSSYTRVCRTFSKNTSANCSSGALTPLARSGNNKQFETAAFLNSNEDRLAEYQNYPKRSTFHRHLLFDFIQTTTEKIDIIMEKNASRQKIMMISTPDFRSKNYYYSGM